jgi:hypothetical protein
MKRKIKNLDLGRFGDLIDKSLLIPNLDGTYDYDGSLNFDSMGLMSLTEIPIRFRKVSGYFSCQWNNIISLQQSPSTVGGYFSFYHNKLTSLKGAPSTVGGDFNCFINKFISLQHSPSTVGGDFNFSEEYLLSKACSSVVGGNFSYKGNLNKITDKVIETVKQMTHEQQMSELDFFKEHDQKAFCMMKEVLDDLDVNYGEETRKMVDDMNKNYNSAKNLF